MAESFGTAFTIVQVTADVWSAGRPKHQVWVAAAKPNQAVTLVLAAVPEGWTAEIKTNLTQLQWSVLEKLKLKPGVVCELKG